MEPSQKFPVKGRSFFTPDETMSIGGGLVLWRGYFQSVRPGIDRMLINVDISTGVMYQPGPLISLCLAFLDAPNNPSILSSQLPDRQRLALGRFITGIRVQTQDAAAANQHGTVRARVVRSLSREGANQVTFTRRGGTATTVSDYYRGITGNALRFPGVICVEVSRIPSQIKLLTNVEGGARCIDPARTMHSPSRTARQEGSPGRPEGRSREIRDDGATGSAREHSQGTRGAAFK